MSGNKEVEETIIDQDQESWHEIKYQLNIPKNPPTNFDEYTQNQDNLLISPAKNFSSISQSSSTSEEQNTIHKPTKRNGYFEPDINQINLNERTYYANFYPYIPQAAISQDVLSNNNGNQNSPFNNNGYAMVLPASATSRIDPSLLNYENNTRMQVAANYIQPYISSLPVENNPNSNSQPMYWNEETVQTQTTRPLPSYYGTITGGTTALRYENLAQQIINGNHASDTTLRNYMVLAETQPNKGKKKRGRKPESDYQHIFSSLPSPTSTDGIRQGEIVQCSNCGVRDTPAWRRDLHGIALLCNACGLYLKNKGVHRPTEIAPDGTVRLMRTQRPEPEFACHNCGTRNTPCWRGLEGQKFCNKCGLFLKQYGYARPPSPPSIVSYHSRKSSSPTFSPY